MLGYMDGSSESVAKKRKLSEPARIDTENTTLKHIEASSELRREYMKLSTALQAKRNYDPLLLCEFAPEDRKDRYEWLQSLSLPFPISLLSRLYGGNIGTMHFVWKIPQEDRDETEEVQLTRRSNIT